MKEKKYMVAFIYEKANEITFHATLKRAKEFIFNYCTGGTTLDLDFVGIWHDDRLVKQYDGDHLFKKYFKF